MDKVRIAVTVPLGAAVSEGKSNYGSTSVTLSDDDIASLSPAARALLCVYNGPENGLVSLADHAGWRVNVARADAPATLAAIEARVAKIAEREREDREASEKRIALALALPDTEWIGRDGEPSYYVECRPGLEDVLSTTHTGTRRSKPCVRPCPCGAYLTTEEEHDSRIVERRSVLSLTTLPGLIAEHTAKCGEWLAGVERAEANAVAKATAWKALASDYVIRHVPDYAEAAENGCDVGTVDRDAHLSTLRERLEAGPGAVVDAYGDEDTVHTRPHRVAYETLDAVRGMVGPAGGLAPTIEADIVRGDTCPERGCRAGIRTLVRVTVTYADGGARRLYVYADTAEPHVHEDEDEE